MDDDGHDMAVMTIATVASLVAILRVQINFLDIIISRELPHNFVAIALLGDTKNSLEVDRWLDEEMQTEMNGVDSAAAAGCDLMDWDFVHRSWRTPLSCIKQ